MSDADEVGRAVVIGGMLVAGISILVAVLIVGTRGGPSTTASFTWGLNRQLLTVAVPIGVLVELVLIYAVWRFRNNDDRTPTRQDRTLEIAWTVATAVVILFVGVTSYHALVQPAVTASAGPADPNALNVRVTGQQWYWSVTYTDQNVTLAHADRFLLPVKRSVRFTVVSRDVIHSFYVPRLGLKQDAIPGQQNTIATTPTRTGEYRVYCAEYCGEGHSHMKSTLGVVDRSTFQQWLSNQRNATTTG